LVHGMAWFGMERLHFCAFWFKNGWNGMATEEYLPDSDSGASHPKKFHGRAHPTSTALHLSLRNSPSLPCSIGTPQSLYCTRQRLHGKQEPAKRCLSCAICWAHDKYFAVCSLLLWPTTKRLCHVPDKCDTR